MASDKELLKKARKELSEAKAKLEPVIGKIDVDIDIDENYKDIPTVFAYYDPNKNKIYASRNVIEKGILPHALPEELTHYKHHQKLKDKESNLGEFKETALVEFAGALGKRVAISVDSICNTEEELYGWDVGQAISRRKELYKKMEPYWEEKKRTGKLPRAAEPTVDELTQLNGKVDMAKHHYGYTAAKQAADEIEAEGGDVGVYLRDLINKEPAEAYGETKKFRCNYAKRMREHPELDKISPSVAKANKMLGLKE